MYTLKHKRVKDAKLEKMIDRTIDCEDRSDLLLLYDTSGQPLTV